MADLQALEGELLDALGHQVRPAPAPRPSTALPSAPPPSPPAAPRRHAGPLGMTAQEEELLQVLGRAAKQSPRIARKPRTPQSPPPPAPPKLEVPVGALLFNILEPIDAMATPTEHLKEGAKEALLVARMIVRGEMTASEKVLGTALKLLVDAGLKGVELERKLQRDAAKNLLTVEQARAVRRRALTDILRTPPRTEPE